MNRLSIFGVFFLTVLLIGVGCDSVVQHNTENNSELDAALSGKKAGPNALFNLDFNNASDAADNNAGSAGWVVDRYAPETFGTTSFDGDNRLEINIDETGPTFGFYGYHGKKYMDADASHWTVGTNARFSYKFYIDPSWETDGVGQQTGVWPTLGDADGNITAYPILEYQDSDANENSEAGFRAYVYLVDEDGNYTGADWVYIGIPKKLKIDPEAGGWVSVEAQLHKTNNGGVIKWRVNNNLVLDERDYNYLYGDVLYSSTHFLEFIFNSANFGVDQNYYYDDVILTDPGHAGK
jgi:hypothetical protein